MKYLKTFEENNFNIMDDINNKLGDCKFKRLIAAISFASFADSDFEKIKESIKKELSKIHLPEFLSFKKQDNGENYDTNEKEIKSNEDLIFNLTLIAHGNGIEPQEVKEKVYKIFSKLTPIQFIKYV